MNDVVNARATPEQVTELRGQFPYVRVQERFTPDDVNLLVPVEDVDGVLEWFDLHEVEAHLA